MESHVSIGNAVSYALDSALLIYREGGGRYGSSDVMVTRHKVAKDVSGTPALQPGTLVDLSFVEELATGLRGVQPVEVFPANVLARTPDRMVWWTKSALRVMYYATEKSPELEALNGKLFPQPSLVFDAQPGKLSVQALAEATRPDKDTPLYRAPYWNVYDSGDVCLGTTPVPSKISVATMDGWVKAFFQSRFVHPNSSRPLTAHPGGFVQMWCELAGKKQFPQKYLAPAGQTLGNFLA